MPVTPLVGTARLPQSSNPEWRIGFGDKRRGGWLVLIRDGQARHATRAVKTWDTFLEEPDSGSSPDGGHANGNRTAASARASDLHGGRLPQSLAKPAQS